MQLMVASTVDGSYVFCGEVGGSVVNALHFGQDPRGKQPFFLGLASVLDIIALIVRTCLHALRSLSFKVESECL